jgi:hypothetical protein
MSSSNDPEQPTAQSGRRRRRPDPAWSNLQFWVQPTAIRLPYLEIDVPLLINSKGQHVVPVALLCRALHIDATIAIRRSQNRLLWHGAELLPLHFPQGGRKPPLVAVAWCLNYPLQLGSWLGNISSMVDDHEQSQQLDRFVEAAMHMYGRATDLVHQTYESGRRGMYVLATNIARLQDLYKQLRSRIQDHNSSAPLAESSDAGSSKHDMAVALWLGQTRAYLNQTQSFLHEWTAHQQNEIVTDLIQVDEQGQVIGDPTSFAPFAVFTDEQQRQLQAAEARCVQLLGEGEALLRGGEDTNADV